ncbi:hypothetical protein SNEBB_011239 [Seison nebaliae]|nr:hypothetical protein SNEBB_011239 [Seison nebaliae]
MNRLFIIIFFLFTLSTIDGGYTKNFDGEVGSPLFSLEGNESNNFEKLSNLGGFPEEDGSSPTTSPLEQFYLSKKTSSDTCLSNYHSTKKQIVKMGLSESPTTLIQVQTINSLKMDVVKLNCQNLCCELTGCDTLLVNIDPTLNVSKCYLFSCRKMENGRTKNSCVFEQNSAFIAMKMYSDDDDDDDEKHVDHLQNRTTTGELKIFCHSFEFRCWSNEKCIPIYDVCDNFRHCDDGSDEINCQTTTTTTRPLKKMNDLKKTDDEKSIMMNFNDFLQLDETMATPKSAHSDESNNFNLGTEYNFNPFPDNTNDDFSLRFDHPINFDFHRSSSKFSNDIRKNYGEVDRKKTELKEKEFVKELEKMRSYNREKTNRLTIDQFHKIPLSTEKPIKEKDHSMMKEIEKLKKTMKGYIMLMSKKQLAISICSIVLVIISIIPLIIFIRLTIRRCRRKRPFYNNDAVSDQYEKEFLINT